MQTMGESEHKHIQKDLGLWTVTLSFCKFQYEDIKSLGQIK